MDLYYDIYRLYRDKCEQAESLHIITQEQLWSVFTQGQRRIKASAPGEIIKSDLGDVVFLIRRLDTPEEDFKISMLIVTKMEYEEMREKTFKGE